MNWIQSLVIFAATVTTIVSGLTFNSVPTANVETAGIESQWNDKKGAFSLDSNMTSCAQSGREFRTVLEVKLNSRITVTALKIMGEGSLDNISINIANKTSNTVSERCANWIAGPIGLLSPGQEIPCRIPLTGDVIRIETKEASTTPQQVSICDIKYA